MSSAVQTQGSEMDNERYPSLASLRAVHTSLLKRYLKQNDDTAVSADVNQFLRIGRATGAILDSEDDRWTAQGLLDYWSSVLYRAGYELPDTTLVEFDSSLAPDLDDDLCPYLGLEAFREEKQHFFFGRQRLLNKLLKHLAKQRLLIVVGTSGSGKSSVVLGGVLPRLVAGALPGSGNWAYYAPLVPGSEPLAALARRLKPANVAMEAWLPQRMKAFRQNGNHLAELVRQPDGQPVVLIIDQFEEVFTLCRDEAARDALVENLLGFVQSPDAEHRLILTLRTDFESQFVRLAPLQSLFESAHVRTTALDANELREAVEKPAALVGLKFEEGLVDELLSDVLGELAALPLLQFTLLKLWDHREHNRVTWEAYRRLGGGRRALAKTADEFYDSLIPEEQVTMRRILLQMVRPGEGLEVTSRRISQGELYQAGEAEDRVERVLGKLVAARLVRLTARDGPEDAQVEVAHEALIRNWPRLVEWLEEERLELRQRLRLTAAAEQWEAKRRDSSLLLGSVLLEEARRYKDLNELETSFVRASVRAKRYTAQRVLAVGCVLLLLSGISVFARLQAVAANRAKAVAVRAEKEAEEQRDIAERNLERVKEALQEVKTQQAIAEQKQQEAEETAEELEQTQIDLEQSLGNEAQGRRRAEEQTEVAQRERRRAEGQTLIAQQQRQTAVTAQQQAEEEKLIAEILQETAEAKYWVSRPQSSVLGAVLAIANTGQSLGSQPRIRNNTITLASDNLLSGLQVVRERNQIQIGGNEYITNSSVAISQDGRRIISGSENGTVRIWDATTGQLVGELLEGHNLWVVSVAISQDGQRIVSGDIGGTLRIWDAVTGQPIGGALEGSKSWVMSVAISQDGQRIVSGSEDGTIRIWDAVTGQPIGKAIEGHNGVVSSVSINRDGQRIVSSGYDETVRVWDVTTGQQIGEPLEGVRDRVWSIAISQDGQWLVGGTEKTVKIWDVATGQLAGEPLEGHEGWVKSVAISQYGRRIISGDTEGTVRIWDTATRQQIGAPLEGHEGLVESVASSQNGQQIVSSDTEGIVRIWDTTTGQPMRAPLEGHGGWIRSVAISQDGRRIVSGGYDQTVRIWDAITGQQIGAPLKNHTGSIWSVAMSQDGQRIVSGSADKTIQIWDAATGQPIVPPLEGHTDDVFSVAISKNGQQIVSGSGDRTVRIWDAMTGQPIGSPLRGHGDWVWSVAISRDGQRIVSGSEDGMMRIWDATTGQQIGAPLKAHEGGVKSIAISRDGKRIVSGGEDKTVRIWNVTTGQPIGSPLRGHGDGVWSVAISRDGQRIVSGSADRTVRVWDAATGQLLGGPLEGHGDKVFSVAISQNGQHIVSGSADRTVRVWEGNWQGWMRLACDRLQYHPLLTAPETVLTAPDLIEKAQTARAACDDQIWLQDSQPTPTLSWRQRATQWFARLTRPASAS